MFDLSPLNLSPAQIGSFNGGHRFGVSLRDQWGGVPVGYQQLAGSYDTRLMKKNGVEESPFSLGAQLNLDRAGDANYSMTSISLGPSYRLPLSSKFGATLGVTASGTQRRFDVDGVVFGDQHDPKGTKATTAETFPTTSKTFLGVNTGLNLDYQGKGRTRVDVGTGMFHLNQPAQNVFEEVDTDLPLRVSLYGVGTVMVGKRFDVMLRAMHQMQGNYEETVLGLAGMFHLNTTRTKELALVLGSNVRLNDAIIPTAELHWKQWRAAFSYDINTSPFDVASNNRGGPELHIGYIIRRVPPMEYCPLCPTYL